MGEFDKTYYEHTVALSTRLTVRGSRPMCTVTVEAAILKLVESRLRGLLDAPPYIDGTVHSIDVAAGDTPGSNGTPEIHCTEGKLEDLHNSWHNLGLPPEPPLFSPSAFIPGLGTVHECLNCGCLVAGGPTRCKRCAAEVSKS